MTTINVTQHSNDIQRGDTIRLIQLHMIDMSEEGDQDKNEFSTVFLGLCKSLLIRETLPGRYTMVEK